MESAIKVEDLSKAYRLGEIGTGTLANDLNRWWAKRRGKEDPFLKIGEANDRAIKGTSDVVWSLRDINFEINQGEAVGIIGRNGAGKSTLLKILSKVTLPTTGRITGTGRIASLLEVGTGFHPELTGRENIYLNGAILGMRKKEIARQFDAIVDFSGVERYIDTPVKRYSSGMYVRLAFAVAAHLESEILIVDEVLAVGDAEFQKKCLGKMGEVSKGQGRTVLFVSHNMAAVKTLCQRGIYLKNGQVEFSGTAERAVSKYLSLFSSQSKVEFADDNKTTSTKDFQLNSIELITPESDANFLITEPFDMVLSFTNKTVETPFHVNLFFYSTDGALIFVTHSEKKVREKGRFILTCKLPANFFNDETYVVEVVAITLNVFLLEVKDAITIEGAEPSRDAGWLGKFPGHIRPLIKWKETNL